MNSFLHKFRELLAGFFPLLSIVFVSVSILTSVILLRNFNHSFSEILLLHVAVLVLFAVWVIKKLPFWSANLLFALMLLATYLTMSMQKLGDHDFWLQRSQEPILDQAEFFSNLLYHIIYVTKNQPQFVAPIAGFFTALAFLGLARTVIREHLDIAALALLASTVHMVFFLDYIENPLLSVPFVLLHANYLVKYYRQQGRGYANILAAAFFLALACLFHGQNTFISPAILLVILLKPGNTFKSRLRDAAIAVTVMAALVVIAHIAVSLAGLLILPGNVTGGGDFQRFVPIFEITGYSQFTMFSVQNFAKVGNVLILVAPLMLLSPLLFVWGLAKHRLQPFLANLPLTIISLGYIAFLFLWDFDLGWPTDHDLMTTLGLPMAMVYTAYLVTLFENKETLLKILHIIVIGISWYMISGFERVL